MSEAKTPATTEQWQELAEGMTRLRKALQAVNRSLQPQASLVKAGKDLWINPAHVRAIYPYHNGEKTTVDMGHTQLQIDASVSEVVAVFAAGWED